MKTEFEILTDVFKELDKLFPTPTLDALAKKAREYNEEDDLENGEAYFDPSDLNCCPVCHWSDCMCAEHPDCETSCERDEAERDRNENR